MNTLLKKWLTGLSIPQEYVCIDVNNFQNPLSVFFVTDQTRINITESHLFLGYKPLVIGFPMEMSDENNDAKQMDHAILSFEMNESRIATIILRKIFYRNLGQYGISFYEGERGTHHFLNSFHQTMARLREKFRHRPSENISLSGNLLDQVRIAYSVPRVISIVTICDGNQMNMFPTDLHGPIGNQFYASSLRIGGKANSQVDAYKKIVISEVSIDYYKEAYLQGKNHMMDFRNKDYFSLHSQKSVQYDFSLPTRVQEFAEMKRIDFLDVGIHRIHLYQVDGRNSVDEKKSKLGHIHQFYAQWRQTNSIPTQLFFR